MKGLGDVMGPLVIGGCRIPTRIDKQETVHRNDLNFQKEMALWGNRQGRDKPALRRKAVATGFLSGAFRCLRIN